MTPPTPPAPHAQTLDKLAHAPSAHRIWVLTCPFNKRGDPVLGSFGSRLGGVVIIPVETWTQLCKEHPTLQRAQFEVGSHE